MKGLSLVVCVNDGLGVGLCKGRGILNRSRYLLMFTVLLNVFCLKINLYLGYGAWLDLFAFHQMWNLRELAKMRLIRLGLFGPVGFLVVCSLLHIS